MGNLRKIKPGQMITNERSVTTAAANNRISVKKNKKTNKQNKTKQKNVADGSECPPIRKKTKKKKKRKQI